MQIKKATRLTESALMIAFATVLSIVQLIQLPYGGSVTAASMLPLGLIAYRYGVRWGLFTGLVHGILQLFMGIKNILGVNLGAVIAILLLDYLVAFAVMGVGGVFRPLLRRQGDALAAGTLLGCVLRYACHVASGCTVWAAYNYTALPTFTYSAVYNATYMLPETVITVLAAYYVGSLLDFQGESITRLTPPKRMPDKAVLYSGIGNTALLTVAAYVLLTLFSRMQDPDTGLFSFEAFADTAWWQIGAVTVVGIAVWLIGRALAARVPSDDTTNLRWLFSLLRKLLIVAVAVADGAYVYGLLQKAAQKAELAAPFSTLHAFVEVLGAMGVKYGLPALVATGCSVLAVVWIARRRHKQK